jgi:hypothetical protein
LALKNLAFRGQNPIVRLPSDRLELLPWDARRGRLGLVRAALEASVKTRIALTATEAAGRKAREKSKQGFSQYVAERVSYCCLAATEVSP